tara:strand:+ start:94890 stop:95267 length:378 start_codon:yes stop_codon:yes gene_type:complete
MDPWTAVNLAVTGLDLLEKAKKFFSSSKTIEEAREMSAQGSARTESLQEQVRLNQQIIDKLIQQAEENKLLLEKHNDILINSEKELLRLNDAVKTHRRMTKLALGIATVAIISVIVMSVGFYRVA